MTLSQQIASITPPDFTAQAQAKARWDAIAKPLHGLGWLEDALCKIAGITGSPALCLSPRAVVVLCADNGVVAQGVSQTDQSVTAIVTENMSKGQTSVCCMAQVADVQVIPVDLGCAVPVAGEGLIQASLRRGTADFSQEPAMTLAEAEAAIQVGISLVGELKSQGFRLIATGEMGIGNTTTATAVLSVLLDQDPDRLTGRGAGLSSQGLQRKKQVIAKAIAQHQPNPKNPVEVLSKVGGLDIAGLCGVFLGGAIHQVPILIDGLISATGALCAQRLCPEVTQYLLPSHQSAEPASQLVLEALGLSPLLQGNLALGEGTGAVAVIPLLDMALSVYQKMQQFQDIGVEQYTPQV